MRFDIRYQCRFTYDRLVRESQNELRACPANDGYQQVMSYKVQTSPSARVLAFTDWFGTRVDAFGAREPHLVLDVVAEATVETKPRPLLTGDPRVERISEPAFRDEHHEYLQPSPHAEWDASVRREASEQADAARGGVVSRVLAIHRLVGSRLDYQPGATFVGVRLDEVLERGAGVCQDFAHVAVAMCRSIGVPARYVSGYLFTVDDREGDAGDEVDAVRVQTHAWFEAAIPGFGWLGLDPTNGLEVGPRHVKIGHGRDYDDVPPLRGVYSGSATPELEVVVDIRRLSGPHATAAGRPSPSPDVSLLVARDEEAALRRVELDHHQMQQQQQ